jgi:hypothetical protein
MKNYQAVGSLPYNTWQEFVQEFISEFCPKNEVQMPRIDLKTSKYFQGSRTVDEYVDEFHRMIAHACYMEGFHIMLKFWQGLNPKIQHYVACLTSGRPSDKNPHEWYVAAILCDENCITNKAFKTSSCIATHPEMSSLTSMMFCRPPVKVANASPSLLQYAPPVATASNPSQTTTLTPAQVIGTTPVMCFQCGQSRHLQTDCPKCFDIQYMDFEKRQTFAQDTFTKLNMLEAEEKREEAKKEVTPGFGLDSK